MSVELRTTEVAPRWELAPGSAGGRLAAPLTAWLLGFAPVAYLGLTGGGYDVAVRGRIGTLACWLLALGVLVGLLPRARISKTGWVALGVLVALAGWTLLSTGWSDSAERSVTELGRLGAYIGVFALALATLERRSLRWLIDGVASAIALVALVATLSRLYPSWFGPDQLNAFFPGSAKRLDYPFHYANGLGEFVAIGLPLVLGAATREGHVARRAVAAAALPLMTLCIVLTVSRGGAIAAGVGLVAFFALAPDRLPKLATAAVAGGGGAVLVAALLDRHDLRQGLSTALAHHQGHQLAALTLAACVAVGLAQAGLTIAERARSRRGWFVAPPRLAAAGLAVTIVLVIVVAVAAGAPGRVSDEWQSFKRPNVTAATTTNQFARLTSVSGSNRYQYWVSAVDAFRTQPLRGIGAGTFEYWWDQHGSFFEFIRNAHSIYLETLAELGIVGLVLLVAFFVTALTSGVRFLTANGNRLVTATALAAIVAFAVAAGYDWLWQFSAAACVVLLLAAGVISQRQSGGQLGRRPGARLALGAIGVAMLPAIVIPMTTTIMVRRSEADVRASRYATALGDAASAQRLEPYAATPALEQALVLERLGRLDAAAAQAATASAREPTNWRTWLVRSRIEAERGRTRAAVRDFERALSLDPRSPTLAVSG